MVSAKSTTQHAIIDIVNMIQKNMDLKLFTCGIFLYLKRPLILSTIQFYSKLNHYAIRGIINQWFSSYLFGRSQLTLEVGSKLSIDIKISYGVPQGSVLGPLLFLIYINDIHHSSSKFSFFLFADDSNLLYANRT